MKKIAILLIVLMVISVGFLSGCNEQVNVEKKSPFCSASASPMSGPQPLTVSFTGSGVDSDGSIVSYEWDFGDGGTSTLQNPSHTFTSEGTYNVTLTITDNDGLTDLESIMIIVVTPNYPPTASASASKTSGEVPLTVYFNGIGTDPDGTIVSYHWDFGDGSTSNIQNTSHTFDTSGTFTVTLTIQDNKGAAGIDTLTISVNAPPLKPITLSGSGDDVTSSFNLKEGIAIFHMTHNGGRNFIIWLYNADTGEKEELLVNEIGSYSGSGIVGVTTGWSGASPGRYLLDVTADGSWQVDIEQPNPSSATSLPQTFTGRGADVPSPFMLESGKGAVKFKMHHDGSRNFIIWLYHISGDREELLVNEISNYDGSTLVSVGGWTGASPGIHYIDIEADGNWRVEVSYA
ncbi:MAG: PKD domain-containing protein [Thermoplasmatales archaeon]|nr:PKD domain-containing protein [Thermoplasmatales archaeon]